MLKKWCDENDDWWALGGVENIFTEKFKLPISQK